MAVGTITVQKQGVLGNMKYAVVDVVGATSYTTTGDTLDLFSLGGFTTIYLVDCLIIAPQPVVNAPTVTYDRTNKKLQVFGTAANVLGATETTNATNLSAHTYRLFVLGN